MIKTDNVRMTFTCSRQLAEAIDEACKRANLSKSKFIIALINTFLFEVNEYIKAIDKKGDN